MFPFLLILSESDLLPQPMVKYPRLLLIPSIGGPRRIVELIKNLGINVINIVLYLGRLPLLVGFPCHLC